MKNENKHSELIEIMEKLQQYVPVQDVDTEEGSINANSIHHILFGGDQLTAARARGCAELRINSDTPAGRLETLIPVAEDWHTTVTLLVVSLTKYILTWYS